MVDASLSLPMGSVVRVKLGGRPVVVRIADLGPAKWTGRAIYLSKVAAQRLGMIGVGAACVTVERVG